MLSEEFQRSFSGVVPLFPLPNVVFFPGTKLPLHIFEPRYQQMLHDARESEQLICIVLLDRRKQMPPHMKGSPPVHTMAGLGRLTRVERLPNGLFNIDLFGLTRVRIMKELESDKPYRLAQVKTIQDEPSELADTKCPGASAGFRCFQQSAAEVFAIPG